MIKGMPRDVRKLRCSFCNKTAADVRKLIAGPSVLICDECVSACNRILVEETDATLPQREPSDGGGGPSALGKKRKSIH